MYSLCVVIQVCCSEILSILIINIILFYLQLIINSRNTHTHQYDYLMVQ